MEGVIAIEKFQYQERCNMNHKLWHQPLIKGDTYYIAAKINSSRTGSNLYSLYLIKENNIYVCIYTCENIFLTLIPR